MSKSRFVLSFVFLLNLLSWDCFAYEPLTTWPYIYEEFRQGSITTVQGGTFEYEKMNVNLINGRAHYIKDSKIMEADTRSVALLKIGSDSYICIQGRMCKVLRNSDAGAIVMSFEIDTDEMSKTDIGYGKSSLASSQNLNIAALSSEMDFSINRSMEEINLAKDSGDRLAIKQIPCLFYKGFLVRASRVDVLNIPGIDKNAVKAFLKKEKIKFKDMDDLEKLLRFLASA